MPRPRSPRRSLPLAAAVVLLAACSGPSSAPEQPTAGSTPSSTTPIPLPSASAGSSDPSPSASARLGTLRRLGAPVDIATGLRVPWGVAFLGDGSALVAERPTGRVVRIRPDGGTSDAGTVPGVEDRGEGGLLGLAVASRDPSTVFAYFTATSNDNRVVRMRYRAGRLSGATPLLTGIPAAGNHNGGGLLIGPDGNLWIGTGDAGDGGRAQNRSNLGGKILRIRPDGSVPGDNPFEGSPVWSYGHRNVQGLAFDSTGQLWATEFGQNTWDELNKIVKGGNFGWPEFEGRGDGEGFVAPQVVWPTSDASPSGLAIVGDVAYVGALRGERLWQVPLAGGSAGRPVAAFEGVLGRLRTVLPDPEGRGLWVTTSNTDGRGSPRGGDDRVVRIPLG
jgi:glucose/arabinose dehydrogenase